MLRKFATPPRDISRLRPVLPQLDRVVFVSQAVKGYACPPKAPARQTPATWRKRLHKKNRNHNRKPKKGSNEKDEKWRWKGKKDIGTISAAGNMQAKRALTGENR